MNEFKISYVLFLLLIITINISVNKIVKVINSKNLIHRDIEMYKIKYSEEEILLHLDFIIQDYIDYYVAIEFTPKQLNYINNKMEKEIMDKVTAIVSERISPTLYSQLSLIYDSSQIGKVIGEKIYIKVLEYVIQFNAVKEQIKK